MTCHKVDDAKTSPFLKLNLVIKKTQVSLKTENYLNDEQFAA
jgi:hypothetical protein